MRKSNWPIFIELLTRQLDPCSNSLQISIGEHLMVETRGVVTDNHIPECSFVSDLPNTSWLQVVGNGNIFTLSTCDKATQAASILNVLEGPSCSKLECMPIQEEDEEASDCAVTDFSSQISWSTIPGTLYRVLFSMGEQGTSIGLHLTEQIPRSNNNMAVDGQLPPSNDQCVGTIPLQVESTSNDFTIVGSTADATSKANFCGKMATRGVFYSVVGTGERLISSTCSNSTTFDAQISVFDSNSVNLDGCWEGSMNCKSRSVGDTSCKHGNAQVASWISEMNQTYFVFIHGNADDATGSFGLSLHKFIGNVETLSPMAHYTPTSPPPTTEAPSDPPTNSTLSRHSLNHPSRFPSTSPSLYATTDPSDHFPTAMPTTDVTSENPIDGVVNNDGYENAIWIFVDGTTQYGSTVEATLDMAEVGQFCGMTIIAPGVCYAVLGGGFGVRLSTCSAQTTYDTSISVFWDDLGTLRCVGGGNNNVR
jgi:hypothetical protein